MITILLLLLGAEALLSGSRYRNVALALYGTVRGASVASSKLPPVFSCRLVAALGKQLSSDAELASGAAVCKRYRE